MGDEDELDIFCGDQFWDPSQVNSSRIPSLTSCFHYTVLVWVPALFFWILTPIHIALIVNYRYKRRFYPLPFTWLMGVKMVLTFLLLLSSSLTFIAYFNDKSAAQVYFWYPLLRVVTMVGVLISQWCLKKAGIVSSGILFNTFLVHFICAFPEGYAWIEKIGGTYDSFTSLHNGYRCFLFIFWFTVMGVQTLVHCWADWRSELDRPKPVDGQKINPELESSFLNRTLLWWFNELPGLGSKIDLTQKDLFDLTKESKADYLVTLFYSYWTPKMEKYNEKKRQLILDGSTTKLLSKEKHSRKEEKIEVTQPSVIFTLIQMFKFDFIVSGAMLFFVYVLNFANPILLKELISFISDPNAHLWQGIGIALLIFIISEIRSLMQNWYYHIMFKLALKVQSALTGAVYRKTLKLSATARRDKTVGEIVNVMAIDCDRFLMVTIQCHQLWLFPVYVALILLFLFNTLGIAAIPGLVILITFFPMSIFTSIWARKYIQEQMKYKDQRTKMINEILNGIKVIKLYAWEVPMIETIENIRKLELGCIIKTGFINTAMDTFNYATPFLVALLSFTTYSMINGEHALTPEIAFVTLTLFNQLKSPMAIVGWLINMTVSALVSNTRMKDLLTSDEIDEDAVDKEDDGTAEAVKVKCADFSWESSTPPTDPNLSEINLNIKKGQLIAVVGKVGSGKSSLISALLGEMEKLRGVVGVHGRVAYVPQQAWIQNMTLQENITFGRDFSRYYYNRVIEACALTSDLKMLPQGGSTEIGEKGINLSGGQKARVSLARAVYQNYDVYLLDDPLSAVDSHVGKHIFDKVIGPNGVLRNKTRILVTHSVTFLKYADLIVHVDDGKISEMGTYSELLAEGGHLAELINEFRKSHSASNFSESSDFESQAEEEASKYFEKKGKDSDVGQFTRQMSTLSTVFDSRHLTSLYPQKSSEIDEADKLITVENIETGRVKKVVYWIYIKSASILLSSIFALLFVLYSGLQLGGNFWLSAWSDDNAYLVRHPNATVMSLSTRLGVYTGLGVAESISFSLSLLCLVYGGMRASKHLHNPVLTRILHAPMSFFDTTPIGRILNRFGKDIDVCDMMLPLSFRYLFKMLSQIFTVLIVVSITTPIFIAVGIPLIIIYIYILRFYLPTARQLRRMESVTRSPIYSHFGETIQGAVTIRAFNKVEEFNDTNNNLIDMFARIRNMTFVANRWLAIRLELIGNFVGFAAALFGALSQEFGFVSSAGLVGVSVSYAMSITDIMNGIVRQVSETEANIVSVERLKEYAEVDTEAPWTIESKRPPKGWPFSGNVKFDKYATRYRPGLELVVKGVNADIDKAQKIGIVGRTGAGKSSLTMALFRMIEPVEGSISIDGINISEIGLHDLRSNITIIPQDPVLFSGTLRFNLDPFDYYSDEQLWRALDLANLKTFASSLPNGLEHHIAEGGENFSVGQRQLVCLARALLRHTKILVLDEATAAVDMTTDALIQDTIRKEFTDSTVITIAHRLNTIMDYDRVIVMEKGEVKEFDSPQALLADPNSIFAGMASDANLKT